MKTINARGCRTITVHEVTVLEGNGSIENIYREVRYFYGEDGRLLALDDPTRKIVCEDGAAVFAEDARCI